MDKNMSPLNDVLLVISADIEKIQLTPGTTQVISVTLWNRQTVEDLIKLSISGIPIEWIAVEQPMVRLGTGEQRQIDLTVSVPNTPELHPGHFPFQIEAASQSIPGLIASISGDLTVAAYQSQGRIGLLLGHVQYDVAPGGQIAIPLLLQNRGLAGDTFRLEVRGLPAEWVSTTNALTHLNPGEQKELSFLVTPARGSEARMGPLPFDIVMFSQAAPNQPEIVRCNLNLGGFSSFTSWLQPSEVLWGNNAVLSVKNNGNIPDVYMLEWLSQNGRLAFERVIREVRPTISGTERLEDISYSVIETPEVLRLKPGQSGAVEFRLRPQKPPIFGGNFNIPFSTRVVSSNAKQEMVQNGVFQGKALIPAWVPAALAVLLLAALCLGRFSYVSSRNLASKAEGTAQMETMIALGGSQTPAMTGTATNTSTLTPFPTFTPVVPVTGPTVAQPTATFTFTSAPPTATFTFTVPPPTPTNTTVPPTATFTAIPQPATATVPPAPALAGTIVFQSSRDGNSDIYSLNAANFSLTRITTNPAVDIQPALAPDGVQIAYVSNQTGNNEIILTGTDLRAPTNLTNNPADDQQPSWSPDGQWIAFTSNRDGNSEIYVMRSNGSELRNVSNNPASDFSPSWFQTGGLLDRQDWIAFTSGRDGNQEIYVVKPDGTGARNLTNNPAPDYSPSGSSNAIAFVTERDGNQEIYLMSVDGASPTNLTKDPGRDYDPVFNPNGDWVAFTSERNGNPEIYVIRTDGTSLTNLTNNPAQDSHPSWR
jgi:hypothetical protein